MRKGNGLALFLIICGALILFGKFGFVIGHLFSFLVPVIFVVLGFIGIKNGSKFFGWLFFIIGLISLIGILSKLIGILIGIGLILYGVSQFNRRYR
ncbi:MAG: hypothetical protein A2189_08390 [Paenibacillus sp. RIFOXYA1_FULL_44_5]|nr:MAG: hypothetical protein A2189_08390 [Paenibacillus sp. RIFOXYA1_FULL_44_5]